MSKVRSLLAKTKLLKSLWAELAAMVVYVNNQLPMKILGSLTPFKSIMGKDAKLRHLKKIWSLVIFWLP
jgi:hypothetical protein